jgi:hypothetical protein
LDVAESCGDRVRGMRSCRGESTFTDAVEIAVGESTFNDAVEMVVVSSPSKLIPGGGSLSSLDDIRCTTEGLGLRNQGLGLPGPQPRDATKKTFKDANRLLRNF